MKVKKYHKLVRDRIPEIIESDGKQCVCEVLSSKEYLALLDEKLQEELNEYEESKSLEELADLLEVMYAVVKARWTIVNKKDTIFKYIFWERLDSLPIPECCFHFVWCQIA